MVLPDHPNSVGSDILQRPSQINGIEPKLCERIVLRCTHVDLIASNRGIRARLNAKPLQGPTRRRPEIACPPSLPCIPAWAVTFNLQSNRLRTPGLRRPQSSCM